MVRNIAGYPTIFDNVGVLVNKVINSTFDCSCEVPTTASGLWYDRIGGVSIFSSGLVSLPSNHDGTDR